MTISSVGKTAIDPDGSPPFVFLFSFSFGPFTALLGRSLAPSGIRLGRTQYLCLKIAQDARFLPPIL